MVGVRGVEPRTSRSRTVRSAWLSYTPNLRDETVRLGRTAFGYVSKRLLRLSRLVCVVRGDFDELSQRVRLTADGPSTGSG